MKFWKEFDETFEKKIGRKIEEILQKKCEQTYIFIIRKIRKSLSKML